MPIKTALTVLTFVGLILLPTVAPALKNYQSLDPHNIPVVLDLPIPKLKGDPEMDPAVIAEMRAKQLQALSPKNLIDPAHALDHFYEALLRGGGLVLHYGD